MPKRITKFVATIFASLLAGTALTAVSGNAADAAATCVAAPTGELPQGGHWYYRIDWPTQRHCWYVRNQTSRVARQDSAAPANPVLPEKTADAPPSIADARAEMSSPRTAIAPDSAVTPAPPIAAVAAEAASTDQGADVVASRWPEPSGASTSAAAVPTASMPATGNSVANLQPNSPAAHAGVTLAAADSSPARGSSSIPKLLTVIVGALSIVAVMASSMFRSNSIRRIAIDRRPPPIYPNSGVGMSSADLHRDTRAADDPSRRIAQMLARLSQTAPG